MPESPLSREELIEQEYFFRSYRERLEQNLPAQDILATIGEEVLATTRLAMAVEFLRGEIVLNGRISDGMGRLAHYFRPFQTFVMTRAEEDRSRLDMRIALLVLEREAHFLSKSPQPEGLFIYQFECIARNRLGYDRGMEAMANDPFYDEIWKAWIRRIRLRLGSTDFADLIYYRSEQFVHDRRRRTGQDDFEPDAPVLFGAQEGRIARANQGKDPLFMFAALQRQLDYPKVPRIEPRSNQSDIPPAVEQRLQILEKRIKLLESEARGGLDLSEFTIPPPPDLDADHPDEGSTGGGQK